MKKAPTYVEAFGRGDRIRTCDPLVPNQMRYQAALHPVTKSRKFSFLG